MLLSLLLVRTAAPCWREKLAPSARPAGERGVASLLLVSACADAGGGAACRVGRVGSRRRPAGGERGAHASGVGVCVCARARATTRAAAEWLSQGPAARGEDRCHAIEGKGMARVPVEILGNALRRPRAVLRDETSNHSALCWLLHRECLLCASVCCVRSVWRAFECVAFRTCSKV